jgi:DNA-binding transcriptional LysR family regulator
MTLDQIETFLAVADNGSFKAASEVLHRSQPALSVAVKKLEEELGILLFDRDQYRPTLTPNGKAFYQRSKSFYQEGAALKAYAQQMAMGEEPEISLAIDSLFPLPVVLDVLRSFSEMHPNTRLNIDFEVLGGAVEKLNEGRVNLAISPNISLDSDHLKVETLREVAMVPVLSKSSALLKKKKFSIEDLKSFPQIIVRDSSRQPSARKVGVLEGARQWSVKDLDTKVEIIKAGLGWGRLPSHIIGDDLTRGDLVEISVGQMARDNINICLVTSDKFAHGPLTEKIKSLFLDASRNSL